MTEEQEIEINWKLEKIISALDSLINKVSEMKQRITAVEKTAGCSEHPADDEKAIQISA